MLVLKLWPRLQEEMHAVMPLSGGLEKTQLPSTLFPVCGNTACQSGWVKLWRNRQVPVFEGKWVCSPACMREMVKASILRELSEKSESLEVPAMHHHRIPLGLLLLSRGLITQEQLRAALAAQKKNRSGRLGEWLIEHGATDEEQVTRALAAQWNVPVLAAEQENYDAAAMALLLPRLLIDSLGALPLRQAGRRLLYVAFEDKIDRCLLFALERMSGFKAEAGIVRSSVFDRLQRQVLRSSFPRTRLLEANGIHGLVHAIAGMVEERKPVEARIVRIHHSLWLRLWMKVPAEGERRTLPSREDVEDMICSFEEDKSLSSSVFRKT